MDEGGNEDAVIHGLVNQDVASVDKTACRMAQLRARHSHVWLRCRQSGSLDQAEQECIGCGFVVMGNGPPYIPKTGFCMGG